MWVQTPQRAGCRMLQEALMACMTRVVFFCAKYCAEFDQDLRLRFVPQFLPNLAQNIAQYCSC